MDNINESIRQKALLRLSQIFKIPVETLRGEMSFSKDFESRSVSIFKRNEFDVVLDDIRDVANRKTLTKLDSGSLVIETVDDYINHMVDCYRETPSIVTNVLGELS
ncbi:MAG: hypothetical protein H6995_06660 [Pseudomonadales bacterium]|nr:hypothetical protein [Pseudomonadales bacterium]MCP5303112.1 hypothetical protein [Pseudomonadales bacterium]